MSSEGVPPANVYTLYMKDRLGAQIVWVALGAQCDGLKPPQYPPPSPPLYPHSNAFHNPVNVINMAYVTTTGEHS